MLCLIWGSTWIAIKIGLSDAPPLITAAVRFTLASAILAGIAAAKGYRYPTEYKKILRLGYPGLYMYGASYALVYFAEQYINSALTAVLFGAYPFFVAILTWVRYQNEKLGLVAWLGMVVGFAGVVLISLDSVQTSEDMFLGVVLAVIAPFVAAWGIVIHKKHFTGENIVVASNVQMVFGGIPLVLAAVIFESWSDFNVTVESVGSIVYLATFGTVATFLGYYWLLRRIKLTTVSLVAFITPLVAIF
ncbi:MAG: EamA family transporter, partial [bacterium]|nr:EamA family transporter [bacterium]